VRHLISIKNIIFLLSFEICFHLFIYSLYKVSLLLLLFSRTSTNKISLKIQNEYVDDEDDDSHGLEFVFILQNKLLFLLRLIVHEY
jgi:hypothetical protein